MTTSAQQLLAGLRAARVPYAAAFMTATAVRFIPTVARETRSVLDAMRVRGMPLRPTRPWRYLPALARALPAIVTRNLRRAGTLADAVESKGFALRGALSHERHEQASRRERWLLAGAVTIVTLLASFKLYLGVALRSGWNDPFTGWIHEIARRYL
jgi:energy-coupling factor transporter transmembrane protein EcfT